MHDGGRCHTDPVCIYVQAAWMCIEAQAPPDAPLILVPFRVVITPGYESLRGVLFWNDHKINLGHWSGATYESTGSGAADPR